MALTLGPYLIYAYVMQNGQPIPLPALGQLKLYATAAVSWVVIIGIGHLFLRLKFPNEANAPADERITKLNAVHSVSGTSFSSSA